MSPDRRRHRGAHPEDARLFKTARLGALRVAVSELSWLLDSPVSNSGRLAARVREVAAERGWPWEVRAEFNPDREIVKSERIAVTSDSNVLDGVERWLNLGRMIVEKYVETAWVIELSGADAA